MERTAGPRRAPIWAALAYRDFRLLWIALLVSNLGTWIQFTAMGFYVATLAGDSGRAALYLGFLGVARAVPVFLVSPIAGAVADRVSRRGVLLAANLAMAFFPLVLGILERRGDLAIAVIVAVTALNAAAQSFESPARQSWIPLLVDRDHVGNAIGLNSIAINAPAIIGPAVAGIVIVTLGVSGAFYLNALSTLAVVMAVWLIPAAPPPSDAKRAPILVAIAQGLVFLRSDPILSWVMAVFFLAAALVVPYGMLLPAYAIDALHAGPQGVGWAIAASGAGYFAGGFVTAQLSATGRNGLIWLASGLAMSLGLVVLGSLHELAWSLPVLTLLGVGTFAFIGGTNTLVQLLSPEEMRGRMLSIFTMIALGVSPAGALVLAVLADRVGLHVAFSLSGALVAMLITALWIGRPAIRTV